MSTASSLSPDITSITTLQVETTSVFRTSSSLNVTYIVLAAVAPVALLLSAAGTVYLVRKRIAARRALRSKTVGRGRTMEMTSSEAYGVPIRAASNTGRPDHSLSTQNHTDMTSNIRLSPTDDSITQGNSTDMTMESSHSMSDDGEYQYVIPTY